MRTGESFIMDKGKRHAAGDPFSAIRPQQSEVRRQVLLCLSVKEEKDTLHLSLKLDLIYKAEVFFSLLWNMSVANVNLIKDCYSVKTLFYC